MRDRFVGITGKHLLMVYPKHDVWQRQHQKVFINELRTLDENVTGTPVQLYEYTTLLKNSYEQAAQYALAAIALLVFIHFRSPFSVALALLPVVIGFLWLGGLMGTFGIPLNPANIMMLPLIIGIGVTNGISYSQSLRRGTNSQHPGAEHWQSGVGFRADNHRGLWQLDHRRSPRDKKSRLRHGYGRGHLHDCRVNLPSSAADDHRETASEKKSTQCRQCTIDTGSGGTEVKTSKLRQNLKYES